MPRPPMSEMPVGATSVPMAEIMVGGIVPKAVVTPCVPGIGPAEMMKITAVKRVSERMST